MWWLVATTAAMAADTVLYVVRHAEKATAPPDDPPLTPAGAARAEALAHTLRDVTLVGVHSTATARTQATAAPAAAAHHVAVAPYADVAEVVAAARRAGGAHLIVGHSDTVEELVTRAGGAPGPAMTDTTFDRLWVVTIPDAGPVTTLHLRYGP
jgi:probable phosphoglycerate mutase